MGLKTGQAGVSLIKKYEGCRLDAYKCPAGVWTIGYGHTGSDVKQGQKISQAQADALLLADLTKFEQKVNTYNERYRWNQNEFDALVSFAFNLGSIDQLTARGTRSRAVIAEKMLLYNKAAGKVLSGLTKRRQEERTLFLSASGSSISGSSIEQRPILKTGSSGAAVKELQQVLKAKGYDVGAIDGVFGAKTLAAVKAFQTNNGLTVDGIVGKNTWDGLYT